MRSKAALFLAAALGILLTPVGASATGLLIPTDPSLGPLGIKYHRATVKITERVAVTHVDQVFWNSTDRDLEATYLFPLPKGATVSDFYLYINGQKTKGEILEKDRARNIYEGIVRRMKDPGLLEYLGQDLFQARVYPVPRRGEQRVEIEFTQLLPFESGVIQYRYPMRTDRTSARTMQDFTMTLEIDSKTPIKSLYSPSHQIYSRKQDDHHASAGFEKMAAVLDRDFEFFFTISEKDVGLNLLTFRDPGEPGFFLVMASPKSEFTEKEIMGKLVTFVIDTSGSMAGAKLNHARQALKYCLNRLNPDDRFNLIRFSTDVEAFEKQPVSASKENVGRALHFVDRLEAAGGTAIDEALAVALAGHKNRSEPNLVVFLTDGYPTVGQTDPKAIVAHAQKANSVGTRVFAFGVGDEINTHLLDRLSQQNFGDSTYVKPNEEIEQKLSSFYDKVSHPVLADLQMDFGSIHEYDVLPKSLPDLFKGSQVIILGRYRNEGHSALTLTGKANDQNKQFVFEGVFPQENKEYAFIPRLWATRKIGFLLDTIRLGGEKKELVDEVIALSKRYGIVTPYTSYLVTEDQRVATPSKQPVAPRPYTPAPERIRPGWAADEGGGREKSMGGMDGSKGQGAASAATPPAAKPMSEHRAKASARISAYAKRKADVMAQETGTEAVDFADNVKTMKDAALDTGEDDEAAGIRYLAGHSFRYRQGGWVDINLTASMKILKVKYLGKAYFALLQRSATLKTLFSLGERITIVVGSDRALVVDPDGQDEVSDSDLVKFIP